MHLLLASVFLSLAAYAAGDWVIYNQYDGRQNCSTVNTGATAYPLNRCLPSSYGAFSDYYNYSASTNASVVIHQAYFNNKNCEGDSYPTTNVIGDCESGAIASYSATAPQFTGSVSSEGNGVCGADPLSISVSYLNVCTDLGTTSFKYSYHGGGACAAQFYNTSDCTGPVLTGSAINGVTCNDNRSSGCAINGAILPEQSAPRSVTAGSQYAAGRGYSGPNCTGTPVFTYYYALSGCSGEGVVTSIGADTTTVTVYENANCTGYQIYSQSLSNTDTGYSFGKCISDHDDEDNTDFSSKSSIEAFPSGAAVSVGVVEVDKCDNPTQTYAATIYTNGCIKVNSTTSGRVACNVAGANTTITVTTYAGTDCTGKVLETEVDNYFSCGKEDPEDSYFTKVLCNAALPNTSGKTSDATSTRANYAATVFAVVIMAAVFAL